MPETWGHEMESSSICTTLLILNSKGPRRDWQSCILAVMSWQVVHGYIILSEILSLLVLVPVREQSSHRGMLPALPCLVIGMALQFGACWLLCSMSFSLKYVDLQGVINHKSLGISTLSSKQWSRGKLSLKAVLITRGNLIQNLLLLRDP